MRRLRKLVTGLFVSALTLAMGPLVLAAEVKHPQTLLQPAGPQAEILHEAISWDIAVITVIFIAVALLDAFIMVKFKRRNDEVPENQSHGNPRIEMLAWGTLILGMIIIALHPLHAESVFANTPKSDQTLKVDVTGHQWWWEIRYPDLGIVTGNEMHIPTGVPIEISTTSVDVIHAYGVPRLGGKNDSFPGRVTKFWIQADEPGVYQGQCFELCGASHARMLTRVIAHDPADFEAWVASRQNPQSAPVGPLAEQGQQIFMQYCAACHTIDGTGAKGTIGPDLTALGTRTSIGGGILEMNQENLTAWISDPESVKPGQKTMPKFGSLSADQMTALTTYLLGLK